MTARQSMTTAEVVAKTLIEEHGDFLREAVALVARELMEAEISSDIGANHGERSSQRATHRNGYRSRPWETRVGDIDLEQNDEWLVGRRYLSAESLVLVLTDQVEDGKEVAELEAA